MKYQGTGILGRTLLIVPRREQLFPVMEEEEAGGSWGLCVQAFSEEAFWAEMTELAARASAWFLCLRPLGR